MVPYMGIFIEFQTFIFVFVRCSSIRWNGFVSFAILKVLWGNLNWKNISYHLKHDNEYKIKGRLDYI